MYVACGSPYTRRLCHAHQVSELAGCQNAQMREASDVVTEISEKNDKTSITKFNTAFY
jgi:hypothetical protein